MFAKLQNKPLIINQIVAQLIILMLAGIGFFPLHAMKTSADQMGQGKDVVADILPPPLYLIEAQLVSNDLLQAGTAERHALIEKLRALKKDYDNRNKFWEASDLDKNLADSLLGDQRKDGDLFWKEALERFIPAIQSNNLEAARSSATILRSHYEAHRKGVDATVDLGNKYAGDRLDALASTSTRGYWTLGIVAGLGWMLIMLLSVRTINSIYRSLREAGAAASAIAASDLTHPMPIANKDEVGELVKKLTVMRDNLHTFISQLSGDTAHLTAAAEEMSAVNVKISQGLVQQKAETEQIATAMNEMSATVQEVARNANVAAQSTRQADEQALNGKQVVSQTIEAIDALATKVEKVGQVIQKLEGDSVNIGVVLDVIKDITEQANLLALNAAIEAARAGEQGRGFAVVANEVRTLAQRTRQSTLEIRKMIESLQSGAKDAVMVMLEGAQQAQLSVEQSAKAGVALETITRSVATITDMNNQIASAADEQQAAVEEMNRNIANINQVAGQTTEGANRTASGSADVAQLAIRLQAAVGQFKI